MQYNIYAADVRLPLLNNNNIMLLIIPITGNNSLFLLMHDKCIFYDDSNVHEIHPHETQPEVLNQLQQFGSVIGPFDKD